MTLPADLINLWINPEAATTTGWAAVAGTGGTAALTNQAGTSHSGTTFNRVTWSVATTAPSGGISYTAPSVPATTLTDIQVWVKSSKAQNLALKVDFRNSSNTIVNTVTGASVAATAATWTMLTVKGVSGAAVTNAVVTAAATSAGTNWAAADTLDGEAGLILTPATTRTNQATNPSFEYPDFLTNTRVNLCGTPSFETGIGPWTDGANSTNAVSTVQKWNGTQSLATTRTNTTVGGVYARYIFNVVAGQTYTASAYFYGGAGAANSYNAKMTGAITSTILAFTPGAAWQRVTVTGTAASTGTVNFYVNDDANAAPVAGTIFYIDGVLIEQAATAGVFFDGDTTNTSTLIYLWNGVAGSAQSQAYPVPTVGGAFPTTVMTAGGGAMAYQDSSWAAADGGYTSVRVDTSLAGNSGTSVYPFTGSSGGMTKMGVVAGHTYTVSATCRLTQAQTGTLDPSARSIAVGATTPGGGSNYTFAVSPAAPNAAGSTRLSVTFTVPLDATNMWVRLMNGEGTIAGGGSGGSVWWDSFLVEEAPAGGAYFDANSPDTTTSHYTWASTPTASVSYQWTAKTYFSGATAVDTGYRYFWTGAANASTSHAEYRGIWVEAVTGGGCPKVQVTVSGLGTIAGAVQVTRTADGETVTVPGWYSRSVIDTDTDPDFAVPLARPVTYTLYFNGTQIGQSTITVPSSTGWIQSPYDPASAMPVNTTLTDNSVLTLAKGALESRIHGSNTGKASVMGASRQYSIGGQRQSDYGATFILHAWKNSTSDQFKAMVQQSPILLVRGLPSWGSIPGIAYTDAPAQETNVTRYKNYPNDGLTQWTLNGELVQPVSRKPLTGSVTNDMVQTNLAGTTYATILARSGSKKNVDVKANPLGL